MLLQDRILQALQPLVGLPLWDAGRALNMEMFAFGDRRTRLNRRGEPVEVGDFALHIQCPWRIYGPVGMVVGSDDRRAPADDQIDADNFDPDEDEKPSRCEVRIRAWLDIHADGPLIVQRIEADALGGFRIFLSGDFVLEAIPVDSNVGEYSERWRLFRPGIEQHFVVSGYGIDDDSPQTT